MDLTEDIEAKKLKQNINNLSIIEILRQPSLSLFSGIKFPLTSMYFSIKFYTMHIKDSCHISLFPHHFRQYRYSSPDSVTTKKLKNIKGKLRCYTKLLSR